MVGWGRLTRDRDELSFTEIVECLGWREVVRDHQLVTSATRLLMGEVKGWYIHCKPINQYRWRICLSSLRRAAVFVARLRLEGIDMYKAKIQFEAAMANGI